MVQLTEQLNSGADPGKDCASRGAASPKKAPRIGVYMVPLKVLTGSIWREPGVLRGNSAHYKGSSRFWIFRSFFFF